MKPVSLPPLPAEAASALARGQKIEAIKIVREHTGLGLKESKDLVDAHEAHADPRSAAPGSTPTAGRHDRAPGEVPRSGGRGGWIVGALLLGAAGYGLARWLGAL